MLQNAITARLTGRPAGEHPLPCCAGFSLADQGSHSHPRGDFAPYRALFSVSCSHPFFLCDSRTENPRADEHTADLWPISVLGNQADYLRSSGAEHLAAKQLLDDIAVLEAEKAQKS